MKLFTKGRNKEKISIQLTVVSNVILYRLNYINYSKLIGARPINLPFAVESSHSRWAGKLQQVDLSKVSRFP